MCKGTIIVKRGYYRNSVDAHDSLVSIEEPTTALTLNVNMI